MIKKDDFIAILDDLEESLGLVTVYEWSTEQEALTPPYLSYIEDETIPFEADDGPYFSMPSYTLTLWTKEKDVGLETQVEEAFIKRESFYEKEPGGFELATELYTVQYNL